MESVQPPPTGSQTSRVPAQRTRPGQVGPVSEATDPEAPTTAAPVTEPKGQRLRLGLAVVAGVLALLCVGGAGIAYVLYDKATKPDRSAPDVVVDNYLRALLVDRNDIRAEEYACPDGARLGALKELRADLQRREESFRTTFNISWGKIIVQNQPDSADASLELILSATVDNYSQTDRQSWKFGLVKGVEWTICEAERVG